METLHENRKGIYVASRVKHAERWQCLRDYVGVPIISTWIDEAHEGETDDMSELWQRIKTEIAHAERLVLYASLADFPLKGALVEAGMALAVGVPVVCVLHPDVILEPRSMRPLGSWASHPLVSFSSDIIEACNLTKTATATE